MNLYIESGIASWLPSDATTMPPIRNPNVGDWNCSRKSLKSSDTVVNPGGVENWVDGNLAVALRNWGGPADWPNRVSCFLQIFATATWNSLSLNVLTGDHLLVLSLQFCLGSRALRLWP